MKITYFTHSLRSCWNHGNAHFVRGVMRALGQRGHVVTAAEPSGAWSLENLLADCGQASLASFHRAYPDLCQQVYSSSADLDRLCDGADLVIVHEWTDPAVVSALGQLRRRQSFILLFHDTHHRAVSQAEAMAALDLSLYDGVLAFGEVLAQIYRSRGWGKRVWVWHEAADTTIFFSQQAHAERTGLVWIGNWGDDERTSELEHFLLAPAAATSLRLDIFGVRYPSSARTMLQTYGAAYCGWIANAKVPEVFASYLATVHVPRRFYVSHLPGIPTIRVFEALACGIPLVSAAWDDCERLFRPNMDFLMVKDGFAMQRALSDLQADAGMREDLIRHGLETIRDRHTCAHRADELLSIVSQLQTPVAAVA